MAYSRLLGMSGSFLLTLVFFCKPLWAAEMYSFVDDHGVVHLTDRPNDNRYRPVRFANRYTLKKPDSHWSVVSVPVVGRSRAVKRLPRVSPRRSQISKRGRRSAWQQDRFGPIISAAARRYGLNSALLRSVIRAESGFNPNAISAKGAVGLMQLMPETARMYGVRDSTDPEANIHGGARFLAKLLKRFDNDLELSLAAYNAGPAAVTKYGRMIPPYPETQRYVARVLRYYREYRRSM